MALAVVQWRWFNVGNGLILLVCRTIMKSSQSCVCHSSNMFFCHSYYCNSNIVTSIFQFMFVPFWSFRRTETVTQLFFVSHDHDRSVQSFPISIDIYGTSDDCSTRPLTSCGEFIYK